MGAFANQFRPRFHLTLDEAAKRFGVSAQLLTAGIRRHQLRAKRLAHRTWVTPTAVSAFLDKQRGHGHAAWNTEGRTAS